ncbi:phage head-tail family protein, putative (macronuclear) [Tetrahymena thermophila SB210]|uniref:Phage head-tail family protein, putative n=1 Tax=Tetrahymena thermophila (strain SB210) TaxID=312017 RepID=I7MHR0_TETTS|nr:phage head-tail family protein, putative [Tetrahymena thermophila SB210]EAR89313.2 phage head-tail family protein, putative [Tetrahymena thermophila SB210]|eukprot:XP_001009558.2 phage head-tail family protein, putative [Tetrahymena thermophila SB210]
MQQLELKRKLSKQVIDNLKQKNQLFRQVVVEGYDPLLIPGDISKAEMHRGASKIGREAQVNEIGIVENLQICQCCGQFVQKEHLSIKHDILQLSFLGSGYPMYFEFLKFCIILQTILFFLNGLYGLLTNGAFGTACLSQEEINNLSHDIQNDQCYWNWITVVSLGNKSEQKVLLQIQSYLNLISIFIIILLFQKFRLKQRNIDIDCDENDVQANDYTILCSNIPKKIEYNGDPEKFDYPEILKEYFQTHLLPGKEIEIFQVGLCFDCDEIISYKLKLDSLNIEKQILILQGKDVSDLNNKILDLQQKKKAMESMYCERLSQEFIEKNFTGYAYIIFQREQDKEEVIQHYHQNSYIDQIILQQKNNTFKYYGQEISIQQAPDPNNIHWKSLKYSRVQKLTRRVLSFVLTAILLGTSLSIIMGLNFAQNHVDDDNKHQEYSVGVSLISIAISICISILNPILRKIIVYLAKNQGLSTRTQVFISIAIRTALAQFLMSSILLILTQVLIVKSGNIYGKIFSRGGLALNINTVFLTQMVISNGMKLIHIDYLKNYLAIKLIKKYSHKLNLISQQQLNSLFEYPEFEIEIEYARNLETVYSVLFYAPVFPLVLIWGIMTIFLRYWIDKYNLMHKSTVKFYPSLQLCLQITESLEYCLPLYSLSNMMAFIYISGGSVDQISVFGFIIGLVHAFLPMQTLNERLFKTRERVPNECTYEEVRDYFNIDYDRENPVKKDISIEYHIFRVKSQVSNLQNTKKDFFKNTYQTTKFDKKSDDSPRTPALNQENQDSESLMFKKKLQEKNKIIIPGIRDYIKATSRENSFAAMKKNQQIILDLKQSGELQNSCKINLDDQSSKKSPVHKQNLTNQETDNLQSSPLKIKQDAQTDLIMNSQPLSVQNNNQIQINLEINCAQEVDTIKNDKELYNTYENSTSTATQLYKQNHNSTNCKKVKNHMNFQKSKKQYKYMNQVTLGQLNNDDFGFSSPSQDQSPPQIYNQSETDYLNVIELNKDDTPLNRNGEESQAKLNKNGSEFSKEQKDELFTEKLIQNSINGVINLNEDEEISTNGVNSIK